VQKTTVATYSELAPREPAYALAAGVDLVVVRWEDEEQVSVLYGRCAHRGALMADGYIKDGNLVCGLHNWDYCFKSGVSSYNPSEKLHRFSAWLEDDKVWVDEEEIKAWAVDNPQPYKDIHGGPEEPHTQESQHLAEHGLSQEGKDQKVPGVSF